MTYISDKESSPPPPESLSGLLKRVDTNHNCQYCQDVGQCGYCKRGRQEISESRSPKERR